MTTTQNQKSRDSGKSATPTTQGDDTPFAPPQSRVEPRITVADREERFAAAGRIIARCRVPFSVAYRAQSEFAGAAGLGSMSQVQVLDAGGFASRLLDSVATRGDWKRIQQNRVAIGRVGLQLALFDGSQS